MESTMTSPRQRKASPWAVDLQLNRGSIGSSRSRTQRSTTNWKQRMQERKAVFSGVAVMEQQEEEEREEDSPIAKNKEKSPLMTALTEAISNKNESNYVVEATSTGEGKRTKTPEAALFDGQKMVVMKDLSRTVSKLYTNHHHVVESSSPSNNSKPTKEETEVAAALLIPSPPLEDLQTKDETEEEEERETNDRDQTTTLQKEIPPPPPFSSSSTSSSSPQVIALAPTPEKDLPRSHFFQPEMRSTFTLGEHVGGDDDESSVFTEITVEDIVQHCLPSLAASHGDQMTQEFRDQMKKSFLAFEKLVQAKEDFDQKTIVDWDDNISVMTEITLNDLVDNALLSSPVKADSAVIGAKLQAFQDELKKSFSAFEALLPPTSKMKGEAIVNQEEQNKEEHEEEEEVEDYYDEYTINDAVTIQPTTKDTNNTSTANSTQEEEEIEPIEIQQQNEQQRQEQLERFQREIKNSFSAFEALLLKKREEDDDKSYMTEYTIEEIVEQVAPKENTKFVKEMKKSFLAFESLLQKKDGYDEESVWDEETIHEDIGAKAITTVGMPQPQSFEKEEQDEVEVEEVEEDKDATETGSLSVQSDTNYEDSSSRMDDESLVSSTHANPSVSAASQTASINSDKMYQDAAMSTGSSNDFPLSVEDTSIDEKKPPTKEVYHDSVQSLEDLRDEKKDPKADKSPLSPKLLLQNTQRFLKALGGRVLSFDTEDDTSRTEPETTSDDNKEQVQIHDYDALPKPVTKTTNTQSRTKANEPGSLPSTSKVKSPVTLPTTKKIKSPDELPSTPISNTQTVLSEDLPFIEFTRGDQDDDDMTQITFDHTVAYVETKAPGKTAANDKRAMDDNASSCSSQVSKDIADILRKDIWSSDVAVVQSSLEQLGITAGKGSSFRSNIVQFGGLLAILRAMDMNPTHSGIQLAGCMTLERMALDPMTQQAIGGVGGIPALSIVMKNNMNSVHIHRAASAALVNISCCPQEDIDGAIEALISSMTKHAADAELQENCFKALANLCMDKSMRLKELSKRGGLAAMTMALQRPWDNKAEHHEAISLLSMLLRNLTECNT